MTAESVVLYEGGDNMARADRWAGRAEDARRREVVRAAAAHDQAALRDLTLSWLINFGRKVGSLSPRTLERYRLSLLAQDAERPRSLSPNAALLEALKQENLLHPSRMAAIRWLRSLEAAGAKPSTVQVMHSAARSLYAALCSAGATEADPFKDALAGKEPVPAHEKRGEYSPAEVERLLARADGDDERLVVMLGLRWADVDLDAGRLVVKRGKGGKRRTIPLAPLLASALADTARSSAYVLALEQERRTAGTSETRYNAASSRLKRACVRAGVTPRGLHAPCHSAGTRLHEQSGDVELISRLLATRASPPPLSTSNDRTKTWRR